MILLYHVSYTCYTMFLIAKWSHLDLFITSLCSDQEVLAILVISPICESTVSMACFPETQALLFI